jgi:surface antigen
LLLAGIALFVMSDSSQVSGSSESTAQPLISAAVDEEKAVNPLDNLSSVGVAVHVARMTKLDEATSVVNKADTVSAQQAVTPADDQIIAKPQVISTNLKTKKDIRTYVSKPGDTASGVASKFDVSTNTILYSNDLDSETIPAGTSLLISPVNGIVYRVKAGDTPQSLADKFLVDKDQLIAFNDAELTGKFKTGELIIIPDGTQPTSISTLASADAGSADGGYGFAYGGGGPVYGGNAYDYGYCTYWAALRRAQIGRPIPSNLGNAVSWRDLAVSAGFPVGNDPRQGAVLWDPSIGGFYGHVAFVERVNSNGSVVISEMNFAGWSVRSERTIPASRANSYSYIY